MIVDLDNFHQYTSAQGGKKNLKNLKLVEEQAQRMVKHKSREPRYIQAEQVDIET